MDLQHFKRILIQVFLLPIVALLLMAVALYLDIINNSRNVSMIVQTDARIAQATLVNKLIVDEESGLRGYQTTGDPRFLEPFNNAHAVLDKEFEALEDVPGADQQEQDHVEHLKEAHQTWHDAFAAPVVAGIRNGGQATDVALNLHGKTLMDAIRADIDAIIKEAQTGREERVALRTVQRRRLLIGIFVGAAFLGVFIGLFTWSRLHAVSAAYRYALDMQKRRADELFDSEQELRTTLASIGDGVITCDADGRIEMMNPVAQELTGWELGDAKQMPLDQVFHIVNETSRELVESPVAKVKRLGGIVGLANHTILIRKDGSELHIADSGAPIPGKTGEMAGIVLVFRDVTMDRRTQEALLANEKLAVAGRLAATIAHEIHNPLDSVSNLLYLMRTGTDAQESKQFMVMAEQELTRVTQISRAMLGLYRESKTPVPVDLREMLQEILLLMKSRLIELGVNIHAELPEPVTVDGFPAELRQVFSNLITNAAEAAGKGGKIWITILPEPARAGTGGVRTEAGATVGVRDNGPGITTDAQGQLFQPFFTTKGEHGTGLGLWVSRGIVNKHGGSIRVESSTDPAKHGTTMSVFLATKPTIQPGAD